jgi:hypothetical protein
MWMSEPPSNWNEIRGDKVFWDLVMAFKESDEVWSKTEIDDEDDGYLHELAYDFIRADGLTVFSADFLDGHDEPTTAEVQEVAGKFYLIGWVDDQICGSFDTFEQAVDMITCYFGEATFMGAYSSRPAEWLLELCDNVVGIGQDFEINGVMHIMTDSGLKPK